MSLHFFHVPVLRPELAQEELNVFVAASRVVTIDKQLVANGSDSFWAICVETVGGPAELPKSLKEGARTATDYRQVLSDADFEVFQALKNVRKNLALNEGVPPYHVATNAQLAHFAKARPMTKSELGNAENFGDARIAKYSEVMLKTIGSFSLSGQAK